MADIKHLTVIKAIKQCVGSGYSRTGIFFVCSDPELTVGSRSEKINFLNLDLLAFNDLKTEKSYVSI